MRDLIATALIVTLLASPLAALAQECPNDGGQAAVAGIANTVDAAVDASAHAVASHHHHWWDTALHVADDVAAVASLAVGAAALLGVAPAVVPIAAGVLGAYFVFRGASDLINMHRHHLSLNPLSSAEARGDYLGIAAGLLDAGSFTVAAKTIGGLEAETVLGVSGAAAGFATVPDAAISMVHDWRHMDNYQRGLAVAQIGLAAATAAHVRGDAAVVAKKVVPLPKVHMHAHAP